MLYRISVTERGLTGIANIFRSRLSRLDDLLGAGTVPLNTNYGDRLSGYGATVGWQMSTWQKKISIYWRVGDY